MNEPLMDNKVEDISAKHQMRYDPKKHQLLYQHEADEKVKHQDYEQTSFTTFEMILHPLSTILFAAGITVLLQPAVWYAALGYFYVFVHVAIILKGFFYRVIGCIYGIEPLSAADDFYMFDHLINPINVPSFVVFPKSD